MEEVNQAQTIQEQVQSQQSQPKSPFPKFILILTIVLGSGIIGGAYYLGVSKNQPKACTQELKQCPDGAYVPRSGPNCEFTPCPPFQPKPTIDLTSDWQSISLKKLELTIPQSWWYEAGENEWFPIEWININPFPLGKPKTAIPIFELSVNAETKTLDEKKKEIITSWKLVNTEEKSIEKSGVKGVELWGIVDPTQEHPNSRFKKHDKVKIALFVLKNEVYLLLGKINSNEKDFDQILSTFKFTESNVEPSSQSTGKAKAINYNLPSGWQTAGNTSGSFEVGYDPTRYNPNPSNIGIDLNSKSCCFSIFFRPLPYDGGSRHAFIKNQGALKLPNTIEKEYIVSGKSSLLQYGVDFSGSSTAGVVVINNSQALFISSQSSNQALIEQTLSTLKFIQ